MNVFGVRSSSLQDAFPLLSKAYQTKQAVARSFKDKFYKTSKMTKKLTIPTTNPSKKPPNTTALDDSCELETKTYFLDGASSPAQIAGFDYIAKGPFIQSKFNSSSSVICRRFILVNKMDAQRKVHPVLQALVDVASGPEKICELNPNYVQNDFLNKTDIIITGGIRQETPSSGVLQKIQEAFTGTPYTDVNYSVNSVNAIKIGREIGWYHVNILCATTKIKYFEDSGAISSMSNAGGGAKLLQMTNNNKIFPFSLVSCPDEIYNCIVEWAYIGGEYWMKSNFLAATFITSSNTLNKASVKANVFCTTLCAVFDKFTYYAFQKFLLFHGDLMLACQDGVFYIFAIDNTGNVENLAIGNITKLVGGFSQALTIHTPPITSGNISLICALDKNSTNYKSYLGTMVAQTGKTAKDISTEFINDFNSLFNELIGNTGGDLCFGGYGGNLYYTLLGDITSIQGQLQGLAVVAPPAPPLPVAPPGGGGRRKRTNKKRKTKRKLNKKSRRKRR